MKVEMRLVLEEVPKKVYVANDGTPFNTQPECEQYEQQVLRKKLDVIERCSDIDGSCNFDGGENMEAHEYTWYRPKNEEEIQLLIEVFGTDCSIGNEDIGEWICIEEYDGEAWVSPLSTGIQYAKHILDALGFDMEIKEKEKSE